MRSHQIVAIVSLVILSRFGCFAGSSVSPVSSSAVSSSAPSTSTPDTTTQFTVTSTSNAPTTTTPQPATVSYTVTASNSAVICIYLNASIKFTLPYQTGNSIMSAEVYLPAGGSTSASSCNTTVGNAAGQLLKVTNFYQDWTFELFFQNQSNTFVATSLQVDYKVQPGALFPNASTSYNASVFYYGTPQNPLLTPAKIDGYLVCNSDTTVSLNASIGNSSEAMVSFRTLTLYAFGSKNSTELTGTKAQCPADIPQPDYLVPIIVGCALAGIILIVLVAYIIGRYRSRNTYQTV